ncbi:hypothetical protein [Oceanobacillus timonensis]|uniref:hypothetical protein n=1 Tax=Oceanobacillus timonensis TaxID=1926285 RepID=UPI0009BBD1E4|nr:hypothetical protein [Oceanobacillus timonensis]
MLKKIGNKNTETSNEIAMEKVVEDLLMISIKLDKQNMKDYYDYWRFIKTGRVPPLEIGVDSSDGSIQTIVFYIDSAFFVNMQEEIMNQEKKGLIFTDTSIFKKQNDYIDNDEQYYLFFKDKDLICSFTKDFQPEECYKNDRIKLYINDNQIIGFAISDLSDTEIETIKSV